MHITYNRQTKTVMARIMRAGRKYQENFSLREYGTQKKAKTAARRWVRKKIEELPEPQKSPKGRLTSRNTSGIVGVWLERKEKWSPHRDDKSYEYWYWSARWPGCPQAGGISWSINQFGDDDAFVLAALCRERESIDRDAMLKRYDRVRPTKKYKAILEKKMLLLEE